jgi:UDP-N-acetyl-D-glucosamine dehydrogenase
MSDSNREAILRAIKARKCKLGVMGLGYVGLPICTAYAEEGFSVLGFDIDKKRIDLVNSGVSFIADVDEGVLSTLVKSGRISATSDFERLGECDAVMVCVPTPFTDNKEPDISYILDASNTLARRLKKGQIVVLRSTTFPETTEAVMLPLLEKSGLKVGRDFWLAFAPERVDPGNKRYGTRNTPVVVGGVTPECTEVAKTLFEACCDFVVPVSNPRVAEMSKLLENIFRSVNIALVNELARLCDRMGNINIWEVIDAASTKPFGFMPFYPGPGIGGHCILVDPYYLSWKARGYDFHTNFIELAAETNEEMPYYVVGKVIEGLSDAGVVPSKAKVLVLGAAFKRDISDIRNSPAIKVIELLHSKVGEISYNDPYVESLTIGSKAFKSVETTDAFIRSVDCVVIATDHTSYDYARIAKAAKMIVDTRNAMKGMRGANIITLGAAPRERT